MSISSKLKDLANNKLAIKTAIEGKNPSVMPGNDLSSWPNSISSIAILKGEIRTVDPSISSQTITPSSGKNGITQLTINPVTSSIDANIIAENIKKNVTILGVTGSHEGGGSLQGYNVTVTNRNGEGGNVDGIDINGNVVTLYLGTTTPDIAYVHTFPAGPGGFNYVNGSSVGNDALIQLTGDVTVQHYENWSCLLKGTLVTLSDNSEKAIEDITFDDELLVWDFNNGCFSKSKPIWIKKAEIVDYWFLNKYKSGKILKTTGKSETGWGHRTFDINKNKFIYTTESVSDNIFTLDGIDLHMSCERIEEQCEFYNIITEKHFNLFANKILTSCSLNNLYPIQDMKYIKDNRLLRSISDYDNIPQKWFDSLRLAENNTDINKLNRYVKNLMEKNNA